MTNPPRKKSNESKPDLPGEIDSGIRGELYAEVDVWEHDIDTVLSLVDSDSITYESGQYAVLDAIYDHIGKHANFPDTTHPNYTTRGQRKQYATSHCELRYQSISEEGDIQSHSTWVSLVSRIYLHKTDRRNPRCPGEDETVFETDSFELQCRTFDGEKFCIGGLLIDPLITDNAIAAATHLESQLEALPDRIEYLRVLEHLAGTNHLSNSKPPVSVRGVGDRTMVEMSKAFGAYSNIIPHGESGVNRFLTNSWGNNPDSEEIIQQVKDTMRQYEEMYRIDNSEPTVDPRALNQYPKPQPSNLMPSSRTPHHDF